jgi:hypothetical protein
MKAFAIIGIVMLVLGVIALFYGGLPVSSKSNSINIGPIETNVTEKKYLPMPPVLSVAAIGAGITLIVLGRKSWS